MKNFDSSSPYQTGFKDGSKYLLKVNEKYNGEVIKNLSTNFESLRCFLMRSCNEEQEFLDHIIVTQNKNLKRINSNVATCWDLYHYTKVIAKHVKFESDRPKFIFHTLMIENYMMTLVNLCLSEYVKAIHIIDHQTSLNPSELLELHLNSEKYVLNLFNNTRKMGCANTVQIYAKRLQDDIKRAHEKWKNVSMSLQGLIKLSFLEYKSKVVNEGATSLRVPAFVMINHNKFKSEALNMFRNTKKMGDPIEHECYERKLINDIEIEFIKWSTISYSFQQIIASCVEHYQKSFKNYPIDHMRTEKDLERIHEKCKSKAMEKYQNAKKFSDSTVRDISEYQKNLEEDLTLEFELWKNHAESLCRIHEICVERYKNNTSKGEIKKLTTSETMRDHHCKVVESVFEFFDQNGEKCCVTSFFRNDLEKTLEKLYEHWSKKLLKKQHAAVAVTL